MRHGLISSLLSLALLGICCGQTTFVNSVSGSVTIGGVSGPVLGPPLYQGSTRSTANPGTITPLFNSRIPSGNVNIQNSASGPCTPLAGQSCMIWQSGDQFDVTWPLATTGNTNVTIGGSGGAQYRVLAWNSTTVATLSGTGTFTNIPYYNQTACIGSCKNSTAYDTTLNPVGIDCVTRITDGTSFISGKSIGNMTHSGGDADRGSSIDEDYLGFVRNGGKIHLYKVNPTGCMQVIGEVTGPTITGPFGFSWTDDLTFYYVSGFTQLWKGTIDPGSMTYSTSMVKDLFAAGVCPGVTTFTAASGSILGISDTDSRFAWAIGPGGQASADWLFVYDTVQGCSTANFKTALYWNFCNSGSCSSSTPSAGSISATGCIGSDGSSGHGIHDVELSGDGNFAVITTQKPWNGGACAGSAMSNQFSVWQIATSGDQWGYNGANLGIGGSAFGAHESVGITQTLTPNQFGFNIRPTAAIGSVTTFAPVSGATDQHLSWPHPNLDDTYPWVGANDLVTVAQGGVYAPQYPHNLIFAVFPLGLNLPPALFSHTYSCGANPDAACLNGHDSGFGGQESIGYATAKGNYFCWASSMLGTLGNDDHGTPRIDAYCVHLQ